MPWVRAAHEDDDAIARCAVPYADHLVVNSYVN
jgi:hypothetical protein